MTVERKAEKDARAAATAARREREAEQHRKAKALIAAAPDLLEALRVVEEWIRWERPIETDLGCNARDAARAAIAKAEGGAA